MSKLMIKAGITYRPTPTAPAGAVPPAPRWAELAAKTAALSTVPSGVWRIVFGFGVPVGFTGATAAAYNAHQPGWGTVYCVVLSILTEALAFLTVGLVRPWGLVVPRWIPLIGGHRVQPLAAIVPAVLGSVILTVLGMEGLFGRWAHNLAQPDSPRGFSALVMTLAYLPLVAWGPLLGVVTVDYARRTLWHRR
ncbi:MULTISPECIES: hypothetical protein [Kitasatospora]|uniref:DUF3995 domain-containing protein n=1 Tax=Kitasatospora cathayae TaxID=3004092 RepID=A0ABY7Q4F8_9ACTN|nr:hypothetical protein [Kitasatospora sp. HUAS 3-15]WBP87397.1 hypothetical protein O1G21_17130 [Kitasatospora sp. HUAS 3-15]